jgi:hypothetical protein
MNNDNTFWAEARGRGHLVTPDLSPGLVELKPGGEHISCNHGLKPVVTDNVSVKDFSPEPV